jgi:hypothetical protein
MFKLNKLIIVFASFLIAAHAFAQTHSLPIGWSIVGNDSGAAVDPNSVFGNASAATSISPSVTTVWTWNNGTGTWNFFAPNMTPSQLSSYANSKNYGTLSATNPIKAGEGFWVNVSANQGVTFSLGSSAPASSGVPPAPPVVTVPLATAIAQSQTLLESLNTNVNLLGNSGGTGFIQQQASGVQADFANLNNTFSWFGDFRKAMKHGLQILQTGGTSSVNETFNNEVCASTNPNAGTVVCQWFTDIANPNGDWATHQITITSTGNNNYSWSDALIAAGNFATSSPPNFLGMTLLNGTPSVGTPLGTVALQTGTATVVGTFSSGNITTLNFSGHIQPPYLPAASGYDHAVLALNGSETTSGGNNTYNVTGSLSAVNVSTPIVTFALNTGTQFVDTPSATDANVVNPVSVSVVGQITTANYQWNGTLSMQNFGQNANAWCSNGNWVYDSNTLLYDIFVCSTWNPQPNWYPQTASFTGSVKGVGANSALGTFMTTTGTGLVLTLNEANYNPSAPQSLTNYPSKSLAFAGSIVNNTASPSQTYTVSLNATNGAYFTGGSMNLNYTDPGNNTVYVSMSGMGAPSALYGGSPSLGTATLGNSGATIVFGGGGSNNGSSCYYTPLLCYNGNSYQAIVYSGYANPNSPGAVIGVVSGGVVYYTNGQIQAL